jgi:hypothetical protein
MKRPAVVVTITALLSIALITGPVSVYARSKIYVGQGGGSGGCASPDFVTDGSSDSVEIQSAVDAASSGDTIYLCAGSFDFTGQVNVGVKALTFQGAGRSRTILDAHERDTRFFGASDTTVTFGDLTMQNSYLISGAPWVGAIWGEGVANIIIRRSAFINNYALNGMGAIFSRSGDITVIDSLFRGNYSDTGDDIWGGGAITAQNVSGEADVIISNSSFVNNFANSLGGAVLSGGSLSISNSTFLGNESMSDGGAVAVFGDLKVIGSRFTDNVSHDEGASFFVADCDQMLATGNTFKANHAVGSHSDGGAFNLECYPDANVIVNRNLFIDNIADDAGGVIDEDSGSLLVVTDNRFIGNYSGVADNFPEGGGSIWANDIRMTGNVFIRNTTAGCGGAVFISGTDFGTTRRNFFGSNKGAFGEPKTWNVCFWSDLGFK